MKKNTPLSGILRLRFFTPLSLILLLALSPTIFGSGSELKAGADDNSDFNVFLQNFQKNVKKVTLPNGLRLLMIRRTYAPTVSCYIKFRAGSADETDASSGIAHMLEHMLFKGTHTVGTRDFKKEEKYIRVTNKWAARMDYWRREAIKAREADDQAALEKAQKEIMKWQSRLSLLNGMSREFVVNDEDSYLYGLHGQRGFNAYTSRDLTNYQVNLPANRLEVWARLESDRLKNSVLRDFYTERNVVAEERRMRTDNVAQRLLFERYMALIYGAHPYGRPVIGPMDSIQFLNYEQAYKFYRKYYAPNNTVIALVGDIKFDETEALVRKYFGDMKTRPIARTKAAPPRVREKPVRLELKRKGSPVQLISWFKPNFPDPADLHLTILGEVLAGGRDSRLHQKLITEKKIATAINIYTGYPGERFTNLFMVYAVPAPGKDYNTLESEILKILNEVKTGGVQAEELERVKNKLQSDFIFGLRSNSGLADELSKYELIVDDYRALFKFYAGLESVTSADIQNAAKKYLADNSLMSARLIPEDAPKTAPETETGKK